MEAMTTPVTQKDILATVKVGDAPESLVLSDVDIGPTVVAAVCRWDLYVSIEPLPPFILDVVLPHPWFRALHVPRQQQVPPCHCGVL